MLVCIQTLITGRILVWVLQSEGHSRALGPDSVKLESYCSHCTHDVVEVQRVSNLPEVLQRVSVGLRPRAPASSPVFP